MGEYWPYAWVEESVWAIVKSWSVSPCFPANIFARIAKGAHFVLFAPVYETSSTFKPKMLAMDDHEVYNP
jgi:hypothetical protein